MSVETILEHVHDAVFATDLDGTITYWAPSAQRLFEYTPDQAVGGKFRDLLPSHVAGSGAAVLDATVAASRTWRGEGGVTLPSGRELWLESTITPIIDGGVAVGSVSLSRDMTATHAAEEALADRARLYEALTEYVAEANAIHEESQVGPALVNALAPVIAAEYVVLTTLDSATGRYFIRAAFGAPEAVGDEIRLGEGSAGRAIVARATIVDEHLDLGEYPPSAVEHLPDAVLSTAAVPLIHDGVVLGAITIARARAVGSPFTLAEREALTLFGGHAALSLANVRLLAHVSEMAVHDGLTGLYNRRHFDASLDLLLSRWRRARDNEQPIAAIMFDLDRFGKLNRDHGHQAGDAILRRFGGILRERLRSSDIVARYGGEEFVAILEGSTLAGAVAVAEAVRTSLDEQVILGPDGVELHATVSAGVALLDPTDARAEVLLRAADVGLFLAKRAGRNRVVAT